MTLSHRNDREAVKSLRLNTACLVRCVTRSTAPDGRKIAFFAEGIERAVRDLRTRHGTGRPNS